VKKLIIIQNIWHSSKTLIQFLPQKIVLPYMSGYEHVDLAGILYMEKSPDGVNVFTVDGKKWESTKDLHDFEEILVERSFFKVNQMVLVNLIHVSKVNKSLKTLTFSNGNAIEVSSNRLTLLLENLERLWNK